MADEKNRAPAFQFYPNDFLSDANVIGMSLQERGAYITLLCLCWQQGTLPTNVDRLARLCGAPLAAFRRLWPALAPCFREIDGQLVHPRLEREREKQANYKRRQSDAASMRWQSHRNAVAVPPHMPEASRTDGLQSSSSSSSSVFSLQTTSEDQDISSEPKTAPEPVDDSPAVLTFPTIGTGGSSWRLTERQVSEWEGLFPGLNVQGEARKALAWIQAQPERRKTVRGMRKFLTAWLTRTTDRAMPPAGVHGSSKTAGNLGNILRAVGD